jgi:hypothetical protein
MLYDSCMDSFGLERCDREFGLAKLSDIDTSVSDRGCCFRIILKEILFLIFERFCLLESDTELITERLSIASLITCKENYLETEFSEFLEPLRNSFDDLPMDRESTIEIEYDCFDFYFSDSWNSVLHIISLENIPRVFPSFYLLISFILVRGQ